MYIAYLLCEEQRNILSLSSPRTQKLNSQQANTDTDIIQFWL